MTNTGDQCCTFPLRKNEHVLDDGQDLPAGSSHGNDRWSISSEIISGPYKEVRNAILFAIRCDRKRQHGHPEVASRAAALDSMDAHSSLSNCQGDARGCSVQPRNAQMGRHMVVTVNPLSECVFLLPDLEYMVANVLDFKLWPLSK